MRKIKTQKPISGENSIIDESFETMLKILSNKGTLDMNRKINYKIDRLRKDHGFKRKEILSSLAEAYLIKKLYEKYRAENALSTFILHSINYMLNGMLRKCDTQRRHFHEISLEKMLRECTGNLEEVSLDFLSRLGADCLVEFTTPEDLIIGKQLFELMINHYGIEDVMVLLGYEDRKTAADRLNLTYESYCKRLLRKTLLFLPVLDQAGYLISD